jgi:hypothetical protein
VPLASYVFFQGQKTFGDFDETFLSLFWSYIFKEKSVLGFTPFSFLYNIGLCWINTFGVWKANSS